MLVSFKTSQPFRALETQPLDGCKLGRRTIVYGTNGSGKSTFSELLRKSQRDDEGLGLMITAMVRDGNGTRQVTLDKSSPISIHVYNRFYVEDSLALFLNGEGEGPPILKLGMENVEAESKARALRAISGDLRTEAALHRKERDELEKRLETIEKDTKACIIADLAPGEAGRYNTARYTVASARTRLSDESAVKLGADQLEQEREAANAGTMLPAIEPPAVPTWSATLTDDLNEILHAQPESRPIKELVSDPALAKWVSEGTGLHTAGDTCRFCHAGPVSRELIERYAQHFSQELRELEVRLTKADAYLERLAGAIDAWISGLPSPERICVDQRQEYEAALDALDGRRTGLLADLEIARSLVATRMGNTASPLPLVVHLVADFEPLEESRVRSVLDAHNRWCAHQDRRKREAQSAVESHHGAIRRDEYAQIRKAIANAADSALRSEERARAADSEAELLEQSQHDAGRMAGLLHGDLREHFGFPHLALTVSPDGTGYLVTRNGAVAEHLSEGERHAIGLAYFLRSLEAEGVDPSRTVVVIDDPVTSLDKEMLFSAFALVEDRTKDFAQTIVLTHDFEYFRLVLVEWKSLAIKAAKKRRDRDTAELAVPSVAFLEAVPRIDHNSGKRTSRLRAVSDHLVRHRSEYHYLFAKVGFGASDADPDTLPLLGNAARRLLEGFLSFRAPSSTDFGSAVDSITARADIERAHAQRIVRFLHGQSHREEARPSTGLDFPAIVEELNQVMRFISLADRPHFDSMCRAVGIDTAKFGGYPASR